MSFLGTAGYINASGNLQATEYKFSNTNIPFNILNPLIILFSLPVSVFVIELLSLTVPLILGRHRLSKQEAVRVP